MPAATRQPLVRLTTSATRLAHALGLTVFVASAAPLAAQHDTAPREGAVATKVATSLHAVAKKAASRKAMRHSRQAYQILLDQYDSNHANAREALGYQRSGESWHRSKTPAALPPDQASAQQLAQTEKDWRTTSKKLAKLHRDLGLALLAEDQQAAAKQQLLRALAFDDEDTKTHQALGHRDIDGYYGTPEQLSLVRNMQAMLAKAKECAALPITTSILSKDQMPATLQQSGLPFCGARSEHFEHWVIGDEQQAQQSLAWAERALVMVRHLLGEQPLAEQALRPNARAYLAILRTTGQRDQLLARAPITQGEYDESKAKLFSGLSFAVQDKWAEWTVCEASQDADRAVGHVMMRCAAQRLNPGLSEGLVHALTWMMCGTLHTRYMQLAHTVSKGREQWPSDAKLWRQRLEADIDSMSDWPLAQIPRERMDNFRDPVRAKSWSFCVWLLARHPKEWLDLCAMLNQPGATQTEVDDLFAENLALTTAECEQLWRAWARKNSALGKASGWH